MALVQTLPVPIDHQNASIDIQHRTVLRSPSSRGAMGSVSSLISGRTYQEHPCRATEFPSKSRKPASGPNVFRQQDGQLRNGCCKDPLVSGVPARKAAPVTASNSNYAYLNEEFVGDWNDNNVTPSSPCSEPEELREAKAANGNIRGPPPKLIPVSGKLEKRGSTAEKNCSSPWALAVIPFEKRLVGTERENQHICGSGLDTKGLVFEQSVHVQGADIQHHISCSLDGFKAAHRLLGLSRH
ncbi:UNVERIFIED_CONTAM: hypothetical protein FKN15_063758 [Acipenser sinensis]